MADQLPVVSGQSALTSFDQAERAFTRMLSFSTTLVKSGVLPAVYDKPEKAAVVILKGMEMGIPPMTALLGMYPVNQNIGMYGHLMLALVRRSKELEEFKLEQIGDESNPGWRCTVKRTGNPSAISVDFTRKDAKQLDLYTKLKSQYLKQELNMLRWRAISACLKLTFSDIINGMSLPEELDPSLQVTDTSFEDISSDTSAPITELPPSDPMDTYSRMVDTLEKAKKKNKVEELDSWYELWKDDIPKLPKNLVDSLRRNYTLARDKFPKEQKNVVAEQSKSTESASQSATTQGPTDQTGNADVRGEVPTSN